MNNIKSLAKERKEYRRHKMNKGKYQMIGLVMLVSFVVVVPSWWLEPDTNLAHGANEQTEVEGPYNLFFNIPIDPAFHEVSDLPNTVLKRRYVDVNFDLLDEAVHDQIDYLLLNLFEDVILVGIVERTIVLSPHNYSIIGYIEGEDLGSFILTVNENVIVGTIRISDHKFYRITYSQSHIHEIHQIDESQFPPCGVGSGGNELVSQTTISKAVDSFDIVSDDGSIFDDGSTIDVMVAYTQSALSAGGGLAAMEARINLAIDQTNTAYANSAISPRVPLVHMVEVYLNTYPSLTIVPEEACIHITVYK